MGGPGGFGVDVWGTSGEMTKLFGGSCVRPSKRQGINSLDCRLRSVSVTQCTARNRRRSVLTSLGEDTEAVRIICTMALA